MGGAPGRRCSRRRPRSMAGRPEVAGAPPTEATAVGFPSRDYRERERRERGSRSRPRSGPRNARAAAPWPAAEIFSGERGRSDRRPRFAREMDGEKEGRERKLTTALKRSETGSGRKLHAAGEELRRRFSAHSRLGASRGERGENGEK